LERSQAGEGHIADEFDAVDAPAEEILRKEQETHVEDRQLFVAAEANSVPTCEPWQDLFVKTLHDVISGFLTCISVLPIGGAQDLLQGCALELLEVLGDDTLMQDDSAFGEIFDHRANVLQLAVTV